MIFGRIADLAATRQYYSPDLEPAFAFLLSRDLATLPLGRHDIDGDRVFASVDTLRTEDAHRRRFETHARYLDVQVLVAGAEQQRFVPATAGLTVTEDLLASRDVAFYAPPSSWSTLIFQPGDFAVYFPNEPHCPCCAVAPEGEEIRKIVVKVLWEK